MLLKHIIKYPLPYFGPKTAIFGQRVLKIHANIICQVLPKCLRIAGISASYRKSGSRNKMVTSDFRAEAEIRHFLAYAHGKICNKSNITIIYG